MARDDNARQWRQDPRFAEGRRGDHPARKTGWREVKIEAANSEQTVGACAWRSGCILRDSGSGLSSLRCHVTAKRALDPQA